VAVYSAIFLIIKPSYGDSKSLPVPLYTLQLQLGRVTECHTRQSIEAYLNN